MNLNNIDTLFLDMDGTLVDLQFDNIFWEQHLPKRYAEHYNISLQESCEKLTKYSQSIAGTLNWYCLDHWDNYLGMKTEPLKQELLHLIQYRPYAKELLHNLQHMPVTVAVITNSHPRSFNLKENKLKMSQYTDFVAIAHEYGFPKEEQNFWHALQNKHPFNPDSTLFIDDNLSVLRSARQYGIKNLLAITSPDSTRPRKKTEEFIGLDDFQTLFSSHSSCQLIK
ncbi:MAG: HAD-IA family hydrolase [Endozoicomonadaceae bacterium]|nr:HAD-IA family hydrolase [Endozoicomonadaceae bacterium]